MEDTIQSAIEITAAVVASLFASFSLFHLQKNIKLHKKTVKYQDFLENNHIKEVQDIDKFDKTKAQLAMIRGVPISGLTMLKY